MDLADAITKLNDGKEKRPRRQIEALQKLNDIFNLNLDEAEREYVQENFSSSTPTSKEAVRTTPRVHGRVTRNNTPGMIPTSEGGGERDRAEDIDWNLTKVEQERVNEYEWSRVPTYEGDSRNDGVATSEGGKEHQPATQEDNYYDCLSEDNEEDEEMEPEPIPTAGNCTICLKLLRDQRNRRRQERNENRRKARERLLPYTLTNWSIKKHW